MDDLFTQNAGPASRFLPAPFPPLFNFKMQCSAFVNSARVGRSQLARLRTSLARMCLATLPLPSLLLQQIGRVAQHIVQLAAMLGGRSVCWCAVMCVRACVRLHACVHLCVFGVRE